MLRCLCGCFSEITAFFSFDFYYFTSRFVQKLQRYVINLQKREEREERNLLGTMKNLFWKQN